MGSLTRLMEEGQFDLVQEYHDDISKKYCNEMDENRRLKKELSLLQSKYEVLEIKYDRLSEMFQEQQIVKWDTDNDIMNK